MMLSLHSPREVLKPFLKQKPLCDCLDQLVYMLYNLNDEEIGIMENG